MGRLQKRNPPSGSFHSLTPTQLKAGAEQTPNSHPQQYFTAVLKSIFPLSCNQGHWCSGPALARDPNAEANKPQTLQSQPRNWVLFQLSHSGPEAHKPQRLQILPRVKKPALASTFCGMASEERIFLALPFFFCTASLEVNLLVPMSILHCTPIKEKKLLCKSSHVPLLSKAAGSGRKTKIYR